GDKGQQIGSGDGFDLEVDVTLNATHTRRAELTTNPVEQGADVTDHKRAAPVQLQIRGLYTDTPSNIVDAIGDLADGGQGLQLPFGATTGQIARSAEAYRLLAILLESADPVTVITDLEVLENMTMTSLVVTKDAQSSRALYFDATFEELRFAQTESG